MKIIKSKLKIRTPKPQQHRSHLVSMTTQNIRNQNKSRSAVLLKYTIHILNMCASIFTEVN